MPICTALPPQKGHGRSSLISLSSLQFPQQSRAAFGMAWRSIGDLAVKVLRRLERRSRSAKAPAVAVQRGGTATTARQENAASGDGVKGGAVCIGPRTAQTGEDMSSRRENTQTCRWESCGGTVATAPPVLCRSRVYFGVYKYRHTSLCGVVGTMPTQMTMVVVICVDVVHG